MTVLGCLDVDGVGQVELFDNDTRPHIKVGPDNLNKLVRSLVTCAVRLDEQAQRLGNTDSV